MNLNREYRADRTALGIHPLCGSSSALFASLVAPIQKSQSIEPQMWTEGAKNTKGGTGAGFRAG